MNEIVRLNGGGGAPPAPRSATGITPSSATIIVATHVSYHVRHFVQWPASPLGEGAGSN